MKANLMDGATLNPTSLKMAIEKKKVVFNILTCRHTTPNHLLVSEL